MKRIHVPRKLLAAMVVSVAVAVVTAAGFSFVQWESMTASRALTVQLADDLTRSYTLLEKVDAIRSAVQQALRLRDPDELEQAVAGRAPAPPPAPGPGGGGGGAAAARRARSWPPPARAPWTAWRGLAPTPRRSRPGWTRSHWPRRR